MPDKEGLEHFDIENDKTLTQGAPSLERTVRLTHKAFRSIFLEGSGLEEHFSREYETKMITHPTSTQTTEEKIRLLGWSDPNRIIKTVFFYNNKDQKYHVFVVPAGFDESYIDMRSVRGSVGFNPKKRLRPVPRYSLPYGMEYGTCCPFIPLPKADEVGGIYFDEKHMTGRKIMELHDFSIALNIPRIPNHQISVHMRYQDVYAISHSLFGDKVKALGIKYEPKRTIRNMIVLVSLTAQANLGGYDNPRYGKRAA